MEQSIKPLEIFTLKLLSSKHSTCKKDKCCKKYKKGKQCKKCPRD